MSSAARLSRFDPSASDEVTMTKIIDEDIIRQKPVSDAYRDGWERTFGMPDPEAPVVEPIETVNTDAIEAKLTLYMHYCKTCGVLTNYPEHHRFHVVLEANDNGNFVEK